MIGDGDAQLLSHAKHLAQVPANVIRAGIHGSHNLQAGFFEHEPRHAAAHRPKTPL